MGDLHVQNIQGTFSVSHRQALSHHMAISHFHSTYEIYYLMSGKREFFIQDRTVTIHEGDIVIIAPNILHRTSNAERPNHERLIINMHERLISSDGIHRETLGHLLDRDYVIMNSSLRSRHSLDGIASSIIQTMQERENGYELYARSLAIQLLIVCSRHLQQASMQQLPVAPSPMHERISQIVQYINEHYMDQLSLNSVADHFYISPYYLSRSFKEATGFTFVEYLNSLRVKEAKKLLEGSALKVHMIARKVGFGSVTHFGRVFKEVTAHPPLFYRRRS